MTSPERPKCNVHGCNILAKQQGYHRWGMSWYAMCGRHLNQFKREQAKNEAKESDFLPKAKTV